MTPKRIMFFSPYSFVNVFNYPEAIIAENLRQRGHEVVQIRCKGIYSEFCVSMASILLTPRSSPAEKAAVCRECDKRRRSIEAQFAFRTLYLDDYVTDDIRQKVADRLAQVNQSNWTTIDFDGIPVPRYASYEYILNEKVSTTCFEPALWEGFLTHVRCALLTAEIGRRIFDEVKPNAVLAYNTNYSCNHVMCCLADQRNIPHYTEHLGSHHKYMYSEITIYRGVMAHSLLNRSAAWLKWRDRPLSIAAVEKAAEHVIELMEARSPWVYTLKSQGKTPETLREYFGVRPNQKVLLVTMASGDERFAADLVDALPPYEEPVFSSQIVWLQALAEWIKLQDDVFLIIRAHPREFPNKRESVLSTYSKLLRETMVNLPANCRVNWPEDCISLHDLVRITDVGLNATSTAGLELLLFGVPVVIYDTAQLFSYPREINLCATSQDDYWRKIEEALKKGRSAQHVIQAFRWIAFKSDVAAIDISDVYGRHFEKANTSPRQKPIRRTQLFERLREKLLRRHTSVEAIEAVDDLYEDPFMNMSGLDQIENAGWLAYAIENEAESHLEDRCDALVAHDAPSAKAEHNAVAIAANRYFEQVGMSCDIFLA